MATNDILQKMDGGSDYGATTSNRRKTEYFRAAAAVSAADLIAYDFSQTEDADKVLFVKTADSGTATTTCCIGVALRAAAADEGVEVLVRGLYVVAVDGSGTSIAAGDALMLSGSKLVKATAGGVIVAQAAVAVTTDTTAAVYFDGRV